MAFKIWIKFSSVGNEIHVIYLVRIYLKQLAAIRGVLRGLLDIWNFKRSIAYFNALLFPWMAIKFYCNWSSRLRVKNWQTRIHIYSCVYYIDEFTASVA